jgi:hypothetical protein
VQAWYRHGQHLIFCQDTLSSKRSTNRNKFCFTGGYIEASVQLPGANNVFGLWPAIWTMGNLGRAGYGASLEGMASVVNKYCSPVFLSSSLVVAIYLRLLRCRHSTKPNAQRPSTRGSFWRRSVHKRCPLLSPGPEAIALYV